MNGSKGILGRCMRNSFIVATISTCTPLSFVPFIYQLIRFKYNKSCIILYIKGMILKSISNIQCRILVVIFNRRNCGEYQTFCFK